ncbi:MAG: lipid A deacylase LpxR family protein [Bacteroidota bacterium]
MMSIFVEAQHGTNRVIVEFEHDNDIFFIRDRYYTSGITLKLYAPFVEKSPINKILLPSDDNEITYYALSFTHHMYTPEATVTPVIQYADHPYATYILFGNSCISFNPKKRMKKTSMLELGWIGPAVGGEFMQNKLHENISIAIPSEGWHNQVKNDFCLQYSAVIEKGLLNINWLELNGFVGGKLGVPHTEANIGSYMRVGFFTDYFEGMAVDVSSNFQAWLYCSGSVFLVNYNAALQGGTYDQGSVHTITFINNSVFSARFGGVVQYKRLSFEYGMEVRTPEFPMAFWHRWGHIDIALAF